MDRNSQLNNLSWTFSGVNWYSLGSEFEKTMSPQEFKRQFEQLPTPVKETPYYDKKQKK
jgi:hypothetical protein